MRARSMVAVLAAMAVGPLAQAADFTAPPFSDLMPADAIVSGVNVDVMFANLQATDPDAIKGDGKVLHAIWYDKDGIKRQAYRTVVKVRVPAKVPGLDSLMGVLSADVRISLTSGGVPYAECMLPLQLISSRATAIFELYLEGRGVGVKPHKGVCDVDLDAPGIQNGIPEMHFQDLVETIIWADVMAPGYKAMEGYCY